LEVDLAEEATHSEADLAVGAIRLAADLVVEVDHLVEAEASEGQIDPSVDRDRPARLAARTIPLHQAHLEDPAQCLTAVRFTQPLVVPATMGRHLLIREQYLLEEALTGLMDMDSGQGTVTAG